MATSPEPVENSKHAVTQSEERLAESIAVRRQADAEFERLRRNLETNHFVDSVRAVLLGGGHYGRP